MVCLSIGGNLHNWFSLLENPRKFRLGDAVLGSVPPATLPQPGPYPDRYFVPRDLLRSLFIQRLEETRILTEQIHAHFAQARFIQLCAPPPIKDRPSPNAVAAPLLAESRVLGQDGLDQSKIIHIMAFDAAPPQLRMKVFEVQTDIYAAHAQTLGALFLPPPPEALTPDGFLDRPYWDTDPTHGNAAYGRLVLKQIRVAAGIPRDARPDVKRTFPADGIAR